MSAIYKAINAVMQEVGYAQKTGKVSGNYASYSFAGEADLLAAIRPAMVTHGLMILPGEVIDWRQSQYTTNKGSQMNRSDLIMRYRLVHTSGESIDLTTLGCGTDSGDKDPAKAMTIAFKYALRQAFAIETGDDPDKESHEPIQATPQISQPRPQRNPRPQRTQDALSQIEAEPPAPIPSPPLPKADYNDMYLPDDTVAQMLYWRARAQGVPLDKAYGPLQQKMLEHVNKLIDKGLISVPKKAAHYRLYPALQARVMIQTNKDAAQGESADYSLDDAKIYIEGEAK